MKYLCPSFTYIDFYAWVFKLKCLKIILNLRNRIIFCKWYKIFSVKKLYIKTL